jgi:membrane-associated protease RseP (regulator of RpoE activity)
MLRIQSFGMAILGCCSLAMAQDAPTPAAPPTNSVQQPSPAAAGAAAPSEPARAALGIMLSDDMTVNRVEPGSPAAQMGLKRGDRVISLNGEPFNSADAFIDRVSQQPVDQDVEIVLDRNNEQLKKTGRLVVWQSVFSGDAMSQPGSSTYSPGTMNGVGNPRRQYSGKYRNISGQVRPTRFLHGYGYGSGLGWVNNCTPMYAGSYYMNCDPGFCNYCYCW